MPDPFRARISSRRLPRLLRARPPIVWTAALLFLCGGLACLASLAFPISPREPVHLDLAIGVAACAMGAGLWMFGREVLARLHGEDVPVGWSIGRSEWLAGERLEGALARADSDLYRVKQSLRGGKSEAAAYRARSLLPST